MIGWLFRKKIAREPPTPKPVEQARETGIATVGSMEIAMRHHQAGRWLEAEALYRQILSSEPGNIDASHFLGVLLLQCGKHLEAGQMISQALQLNATNPPAHNNLGLVLLAQGKKSDAAASFRKALALAPDYLDALRNLGNALVASGDLDGAVATYRRALLMAPENAELWFTLGNALYAQGERDSAVASYREAIRLRPAYPEAHSNLGSMLKEQGKLDLAVASYEEAVRLNPQYFEALYNLGVAQRDLGRYGEAVHFLRKALALRPDSAVAHFCLGHMLSDEDHRAQALECFSKALALNPEYQEARWSLAMSQLPAVHGVGDDPQFFRAAFSAQLHSLEHWFDSARIALGENTVGTQQPFRLAYQEEDNRPLLERYGRLCVRLMSNWQQRAGLRVAEIRRPGPIRVGFVSQHLRNHSVWNALIKGWIQQLDTRRFELYLFCIGNTVDSETQFARSRAARFEQGSHGLRQWTSLILDARPDVLIYPEIGMDPMSLRLASMRLARLQAASWGHPETTGLPTIDAYLSAQALEPDAAQANYTERLIALPGLGCYLQKNMVEVVGVDLSAWGVSENIPKLICAGTPFKYAPQHDWVFPEIARRLGPCRFLFFTHSTRELSEKLRARLASAFARSGLDFERYVSFVPWQARGEFLGLLSRADVYLDSIGFSGFNSALQAVECGLPIVTREGRFMRGRLASGILKRMGLQDLVAADEEQYVALAVRLVRDAEFRESIRRRIESGRHLLYGDTAPIRALEDFLAQGG